LCRCPKNGYYTNSCVHCYGYIIQEPFCYVQDNEIVGYDTELMIRVAEKLGYDIQVTNMDFNALMPSIKTEKTDVAIGCITVTKERAQSVDFTEPTYESGTVAVYYQNQETEQGILTRIRNSFHRTFVAEQRWKMIGNGLLVTVQISVLSLVFGTVLGFLYSFALRSKRKPVRALSEGFSTIWDGMPTLVILMVFYYIIFSKTQIPAVWVAVLAFSLDFANTVAGLLNTGVKAVDPGEIEAASAMGYNKWQIFRKITFPQAARHMVGQYNGAVIGMIKGTSVVGYITIQDLTKAGDIIRSRTYEAFFPLIAVAVIYFLLAYGIIFLIKKLEIYLEPKHRPRTIKGVRQSDRD
ncbi:MAG: ABC transporter substrate-binding protein/permease, partial [Lachnospiraceae bacterium]